MRKKKTQLTFMAAVLAVMATLLSACVDNGYDLTNDIDLTITFGGDSLLVPASNTEELFMDDILDIEEGSSVVVANQGDYGMDEGDYYLYAANDEESNHSTVTADGVTVSGTTVDFAKQSFSSATTLPTSTAHFTMENSVSPTIQAIERAQIDCTVDISFSATNSGTSLENGFTIQFPSFISLEDNGSGSNAGKYSVQGNTITVTQSIGLPATLKVNAVQADINEAATGEVSFTPGNRSTSTDGYIELQGDISLAGAVNATGSTEMTTQVVIEDMVLERMYGIIDPEININVDPMNLNDVPDVLQDEDTNLDWTNPQLYLTVTNPTELSINFTQIKFTSDLDHEDGTTTRKELTVGTGMDNTDGTIVVGPDASGDGYTICLSQTGAPIKVDDDVKITGMADLLRQIPDRIEVTGIEASAMQYSCWIDLDRTYDLDVHYEMVAPLSFGSDLTIAYKDTIDGWTYDLRKVERANELKATFDVVNKVPLELTLSAVAVDEQGNEIDENDIKCTVVPEQKAIAQGSIDSPTVSEAEVTITAKDGDISRLDGIIVRLTSTKGDNSGASINQKQSIKLENVRLLLLGGVTLDLN